MRPDRGSMPGSGWRRSVTAGQPHGPTVLGAHIWQTPRQNVLETFSCSIHSRRQGHCQSPIAREGPGDWWGLRQTRGLSVRAGRAAGRGPHTHSGNSCAAGQAAVPRACPPVPLPTPRPLVVPPWSLLLATLLCGPQTGPWLLAPTAGLGRLPEDTLEEGESAASCVWGARRHRQHGSSWPQRRAGCGLGGRQGRGGWWAGAVPFCSAPRQRRWGPLPLGDASQGPVGRGRRPAHSPRGQAWSLWGRLCP